MRKLLLALTLFTLASCVQERVVEQRAPEPYVVYVHKAPPIERAERQPPPPSEAPDWVWQKGHWRWNGYNYYWIQGKWARPGGSRSHWTTPHWEHDPSRGWHFVEGRWE